jgi:L-asparagine oxygenase
MIPQVQAPSPISLPVGAESRLHLPAGRRDAWTRAALAMEYPDWSDLAAWSRFCDSAARLAEEHLSPALDAALGRFLSPQISAPAGEFLVLENLPVDPSLPPVPLDGLRPAGKQPVSEAVIAGLIGRRAQILSYANEKAGSPIQELAPVPGLETTQSNAGRTAMNYHTDGAFLPAQFRPRGLLLFGLVNMDTATLVLTAERVMEAAPSALLAALARPWFRHARPHSFSGPAASPPAPILWRDDAGMACVAVASSSIEPTNDAAREALYEFRALCARLEPTRIVIAPGTALLFRNDRVLHGRETVAGTRWLQRAYFTDTLEPLRHATRSDPRAFCFDARTLLESS